MNYLILLVKLIALLIFYFISAYTILCGKSKSGINLDYAITSIIILAVMIAI